MYKVHIVLKDGTELEVPEQDVKVEVCGTTLDVKTDDIPALVEGELTSCFTEGYLSATELAALIDGTDGVILSDRELEKLKETVLVIVKGKQYSWMDVKEIYVTRDEEEDAGERITHNDVLGIEIPAEGEAVVLVLGHEQEKRIPVSKFVEKYWDTLYGCSIAVHSDALVRIGRPGYMLEFKGGVAVIDFDRFDLKPDLGTEDVGWIPFKYVLKVVRSLRNLHNTLAQHVMGEADVSELLDKVIELRELKEKLGEMYDSIVRGFTRLLWIIPYIDIKD